MTPAPVRTGGGHLGPGHYFRVRLQTDKPCLRYSLGPYFSCVCDSSWTVGLGADETQKPEYFGPGCSLSASTGHALARLPTHALLLRTVCVRLRPDDIGGRDGLRGRERRSGGQPVPRGLLQPRDLQQRGGPVRMLRRLHWCDPRSNPVALALHLTAACFPPFRHKLRYAGRPCGEQLTCSPRLVENTRRTGGGTGGGKPATCPPPPRSPTPPLCLQGLGSRGNIVHCWSPLPLAAIAAVGRRTVAAAVALRTRGRKRRRCLVDAAGETHVVEGLAGRSERRAPARLPGSRGPRTVLDWSAAAIASANDR